MQVGGIVIINELSLRHDAVLQVIVMETVTELRFKRWEQWRLGDVLVGRTRDVWARWSASKPGGAVVYR